MADLSNLVHTGCVHEAPARLPEPRKKIVAKIVKYLKTRLNDFDGIVISGYSMAMIGSIIAYKLNLPMCVIAKPDDKRNTSIPVEGLHSQRWLMIDDLVSSGRTLERIHNGVKEIDGTLVGLVLWKLEQSSASFYPGGDYSKSVRVPVWYSFSTNL